MLNLTLYTVVILSFTLSLEASLQSLQKRVLDSDELFYGIERLEYCARLSVLSKNIEQTQIYLEKDLESAKDIESSWLDHTKSKGINCPYLKKYIKLSYETNTLLPEGYPNWSYKIDIPSTSTIFTSSHQLKDSAVYSSTETKL